MTRVIKFSFLQNIEFFLSNFGCLKRFIPNLVFDKYIESSYLDKTMFWLNPVNNNLTYTVFKVKQ
jgi:hypothetical protein